VCDIYEIEEMKIGIVGTGYVGLVSGACFAEMGVSVTCVDIDTEKIEGLKQGKIPIYEPGLEEIVKKNICCGKLNFTTSLAEAMPSLDILFIAVGTPPDEDGSADLKNVLQVASEIGRKLDKYMLIVTKSTVPVGTSGLLRKTIQAELDRRGVKIEFDVASNPEFLKEGSAIKDFMSPDRVIVGTDTRKAEKLMAKLYKPFVLNNFNIMFMDINVAEMVKYAANSMLATRISFMNELANLCGSLGIDINLVRKGIASDSRIGTQFLYAGCGYGGSCFPKDVKALIRTGLNYGHPMDLLRSVESVNKNQKRILFKKISDIFNGTLKGRTIAIWGLSFKPETDDVRDAPAFVLAGQLNKAGCNIKAYDPIAAENFSKQCKIEKITYTEDMYSAVVNADALVLVTEWKTFRLPDWNRVMKLMNDPVIIDGRNIYTRSELESMGFRYEGIGT
jgi:UDPglucose 6-dehydrogenase